MKPLLAGLETLALFTICVAAWSGAWLTLSGNETLHRAVVWVGRLLQ